ncbi:MAG: hypothetical protein ABJD68_08770 [Nakamurella sp.]
MTTEVTGRVDVTVGADINPSPHRSLSVSQLQGAMRAAHRGVDELGADKPEIGTTSRDGVADDRQSRNNRDYHSIDTPGEPTARR